MRSVICIALLLAGFPALAGEVRLDGAAIKAALNGATLAGERGGTVWRQRFLESGLTIYTEQNGRQTRGDWAVRDDRFCSVWPPSRQWACYDMFKEGETLIFVDDSGSRWPARRD